MKTIFVPVGGTAADEVVFETAYAAARLFDAHLAFFHVRIGAAESALSTPHAAFARGEGLRAMLHQLASNADRRAKAARREIAAFCAKRAISMAEAPSRPGAVTADCREESGDAMQRLMFEARHHDLVVLGRAKRPNGLPPDFAERLLLGCGRPLLIVPAAPRDTLTGTVLVCWKETVESARAVTAAMPFLAKAREIVIAGVGEGDTKSADGIEALARQLRWHGPQVRTVFSAEDPRTADLVLREAAHACHADLLVMGGYGRSRARELIFGGVTQAMLDSADLPVFLCH